MRRMPAVLVALAAAGLAIAGPDKDHKHAETPAVDIAEVMPDYKLPALWFGSKAPELRIAEFVKGDPVTSFEPGRVYVVEFWATWCGPCVAAFPHLTMLQDNYKDKLTVIGVNIWDTKKDRVTKEVESQADRLTRVAEFVEDQGMRMGYTVAVEDGEKMAESWMEQAGRGGIPSAFIVDQEGRIAWMGHPMGMDKPLEQILEGKYDSTEAAKEAAAQHKEQAWFSMTMEQLEVGGPDAYAVVTKAIKAKFYDSPQQLNAIAWTILDNKELPNPDYKVALMASKRACELTEWKEPSVLDTYALAAFKNGKVKNAIEAQKKAIELIKGTQWESAMDEFQSRLDMYEAAL